MPKLAEIYIHGSMAKSWEQVAKYLSGDAHDRSKVQVFVNGKFYNVGLPDNG